MRRVLITVIICSSVLALSAQQQAPAPNPPQGGRGRGAGAPPGPPPAGRTQAPYDLTGYWVSLVTDDWRYRMLTPPKGNADYIPVNAEARRVMDTWDPARDDAAGEACRAFGAAGVMRLPTRLHITWDDDNTMRLETDAGTQTRRLLFGAAQTPAGEPTWQGVSVARWMFAGAGGFGGRAGGGRGARPETGQLVVTTTRMKPGYLRKNGVPYSANAVLTEYFLRLVDDDGQEYLAVTMMVDDPQYLQQPYVKTYEYKKQRDAAGWNPTPCKAG